MKCEDSVSIRFRINGCIKSFVKLLLYFSVPTVIRIIATFSAVRIFGQSKTSRLFVIIRIAANNGEISNIRCKILRVGINFSAWLKIQKITSPRMTSSSYCQKNMCSFYYNSKYVVFGAIWYMYCVIRILNK